MITDFIILTLFLISCYTGYKKAGIPVKKILSALVNLFSSILTVAVLAWILQRYPLPLAQNYQTGSRVIGFLGNSVNPFLEPLGKALDRAEGGFNQVYLSPEIGEVKKLAIPYIGPNIDIEGENQMVEMVNKEREAVGLNKLTKAEDLTQVARVHGLDMWQKQYFSHISPDNQSPFDRLDQYGVKYIFAGENLALAPNVGLAEEGLMLSPSHRENILGANYRKIGIGAQGGGKRAGIIFVQLFSD